jgi:hypothetical protein
VNALLAPAHISKLSAHFKLRPACAVLLAELIAHPACTRTQLERALRAAGSTATSRKSLDVTLGKLRAKIGPVAAVLTLLPEEIANNPNWEASGCGRPGALGYSLHPDGLVALAALARELGQPLKLGLAR